MVLVRLSLTAKMLLLLQTLASPRSNQTAGSESRSNNGDEEENEEEYEKGYEEADIIEACRRLYDRCLLWFDTGADNSSR
jgi:hypothetical protein